jgi:hypothetical protein
LRNAILPMEGSDLFVAIFFPIVIILAQVKKKGKKHIIHTFLFFSDL